MMTPRYVVIDPSYEASHACLYSYRSTNLTFCLARFIDHISVSLTYHLSASVRRITRVVSRDFRFRAFISDTHFFGGIIWKSFAAIKRRCVRISPRVTQHERPLSRLGSSGLSVLKGEREREKEKARERESVSRLGFYSDCFSSPPPIPLLPASVVSPRCGAIISGVVSCLCNALTNATSAHVLQNFLSRCPRRCRKTVSYRNQHHPHAPGYRRSSISFGTKWACFVFLT